MIYRSKETVCSITVPRDPEYLALVQDILEHPLVRSMEAYTQHGETSCLRHSINVSYLSYLYCRDHGWQARAAARAGLLPRMEVSGAVAHLNPDLDIRMVHIHLQVRVTL